MAVPHVVVRIQFYRTCGVRDALFWLRRRRYGVGVRAAAPVSGDFGLYSDCFVVTGNRGEPDCVAHVRVSVVVRGACCGVCPADSSWSMI